MTQTVTPITLNKFNVSLVLVNMTDIKADSLREKDIESLYCDTLLVKPVNYDWYRETESWEKWEVIQPFTEIDFIDEDGFPHEDD